MLTTRSASTAKTRRMARQCRREHDADRTFNSEKKNFLFAHCKRYRMEVNWRNKIRAEVSEKMAQIYFPEKSSTR